jgi:uroporphyrinogen-III synthase
MNEVTLPLDGLGVLLTRPAGQALRTAQALRSAGARVFEFPALQIAAITPDSAFDAAMAMLPIAKWAIFVSANAVEFGMPHVKRHGGFAAHTRIAAIGNATRAALLAHGVAEVIAPSSGFDSEALLTHPDLLQVALQPIIIFRGQSESGGRKMLGYTLADRGALVHYAECYRRAVPDVDSESRGRLLDQWERGEIQAIHVMSFETLRNLDAMLGERGQELLKRLWIVVPHGRIAQAARSLGCGKVEVAGLKDSELIECLARLKAQHLATTVSRAKQ